MNVRIQDPEAEIDITGESFGSLTDSATELAETAIRLMGLEMDLADETLTGDMTQDGKRTLIWEWADGRGMPLTMIFWN